MCWWLARVYFIWLFNNSNGIEACHTFVGRASYHILVIGILWKSLLLPSVGTIYQRFWRRWDADGGLLIYFWNREWWVSVDEVNSSVWIEGKSYKMFTFPNSIRGRLGSFPMFLLNIGCLLGYISGAKLDYYYIPCISVVFPIVFLVIFSIFPNTPQYYIRKEKTKVSVNLTVSLHLYRRET